MPTNTMPRSCNRPTCPTCQQLDRTIRWHECATACADGETPTDGRAAGCCNCFAAFLTVEHFPDPVATGVDNPTIAIGGMSFNTVDKRFEGTASEPLGPSTTDVFIYFFRDAGVCKVKLESTLIGDTTFSFTEGDAGECEALHFTVAAPAPYTGTIVINGRLYRPDGGGDFEECTVECTEPRTCFTFTASGTTVNGYSYEVPVSINERVEYDLVGLYTEFPITSCNATGFAKDRLETSPGVFVDLFVGASIIGRNLYIYHEVYDAGGPAVYQAFQLYSIDDFQVPGTPAATLDLTEQETTEAGITPGTVAQLIPDEECIPPASACGSFPRCLALRIPEGTVTDGDDCTACETLVGVYFLERLVGSCTWYGSIYNTAKCISEAGGASAQWILAFDVDTGVWTLEFVIYNGGGSMIGSLVTYTVTAASLTLPLDLALDSESTECDWPATVSLFACSTSLIFGACCNETSICGETTKAECDSLGGTWLGPGSRCWLEGCSGCSEDCSMLCDYYEFEFTYSSDCSTFFDAGVTLTLERNGNNGTTEVGLCGWYGEFGASLNATMTVDDSVSPPTRTIHIIGLSDDTNTTFEFDLVAVGDYYCDGVEIANWSIENFTTTNGAVCASAGTGTFILRQQSGCPPVVA